MKTIFWALLCLLVTTSAFAETTPLHADTQGSTELSADFGTEYGEFNRWTLNSAVAVRYYFIDNLSFGAILRGVYGGDQGDILALGPSVHFTFFHSSLFSAYAEASDVGFLYADFSTPGQDPGPVYSLLETVGLDVHFSDRVSAGPRLSLADHTSTTFAVGFTCAL